MPTKSAKRGGSKCSVKKQKAECDAAANECVWGKTGKCSQKRKPGKKASAASASAVSLHRFFPPVAKQASPMASLLPAASLSPAASPKSQGSQSPKSHVSLLSQGSQGFQGSQGHEEEEEPLVQKTKEDFQPGATLKNVRANGDVDLRGHNMKGIKIAGGNMNSVDLRGADLSGATLENIMFYNAKLDGANLTGATIRNCGFEDASVKEARFSDARITESDMNKLSSADKAQFNDSVLTNVRFSGSKFREANFANAKFEGAETQLNGVSFEKANLTGASFGNGVVLTDPHMNKGSSRRYDYISFKGANLQKVKFSPNGRIAELAYNNFEGANLTGANLAEADLRYCKFEGATMTDASLSMADLRDSELSVAALKDAFIDGATFNTLKMVRGVLRFED